MKAIVGYTGFVGSNLTASGDFDAKYNSGNIREAFGTKPDLLVYSGLRAEKYLANNDREKDLLMIKDAENNSSEIAPKKLVLISTIDVFKSPLGVDENSTIDVSGLAAYGYHRYLLECRVRENYPDALIIRLPGLFGRNIKKNFIYDFINVIPFMLNEKKFLELSGKQPELLKYYDKQANGFYKVNVTGPEKEGLKDMFRALGFSALNFTDSRSRFQFYDLKDLWADMNIALNSGITLWHPATEPVSAGELYRYLTGEDFVNELASAPADYDFRTIHDALFNGKNGYIRDKESVLAGIRNFVEEYSKQVPVSEGGKQ